MKRRARNIAQLTKEVVLPLVWFVLSVSYGCLNYRVGSKEAFIITTGAMVLLSACLFWIYFQRIYWPLVRIRAAIKAFEDESDANRSSDIPSLSRNITNMLVRLRESMNREYTSVLLKKQAEFAALQSQINPHFLYNTLDSIRGEALVEGNAKIAEMTEALSTFFRYGISQKGDLVSLAEELDNVSNYMIIQQYRFSDKFELKVIADKDNLEHYLLPKLTMQPIVENAILHGLETKLGKGTITIRITITRKRLLITVADDGIGMDSVMVESLNRKLTHEIEDPLETCQQKSTGIALVNVNQRIRFLFGEEYGITISSTKDVGTDVEIVLPLVLEDKAQGDSGGFAIS